MISTVDELRARLAELRAVRPGARVALVSTTTFLPVDAGSGGPALALIAATAAGHPFIDNAEIHLG